MDGRQETVKAIWYNNGPNFYMVDIVLEMECRNVEDVNLGVDKHTKLSSCLVGDTHLGRHFINME